MRRATTSLYEAFSCSGISIHALREEGDTFSDDRVGVTAISIHALREEGDYTSHWQAVKIFIFQSTPSVRRATKSRGSVREEKNIFQSTPSVRRATRDVLRRM